ncbi:MAG: hypothetical protein PHD43_00090 [Methylococcales bacterium]|nr:hypothetical protein [Methylococcales bacterium]
MNSKLMSVLALVCTVLVLIIIGEWLYAVQAQKRSLAPTTSKETKISLDEMPGIELSRQTEESYADMVARPLFIKGRKPVDEPSREEVQGFTLANTFDWQLNGVYSTKQGLFALFSRSTSKVPKDNYRKITADADLDGWKLTEIHKDRVLLKQGDQQKELLLRKPKIKESPIKPSIPNKPNAPNMPNIPNSRQLPSGDFENKNEHF